MKPSFLIYSVLGIALLFNSPPARSQQSDILIKVKSESKLLFQETGMLKNAADKIYFSVLDPVKKSIEEWLKKDIKDYCDETVHSINIQLTSYPAFRLSEFEGKTYIEYVLENNSLAFRVTTPDAPTLIGKVGLPRDFDPDVRIIFEIKGLFELKQGENADNIILLNPYWFANITDVIASNLSKISFSETDLDLLKTSLILSSFGQNFHPLNPISDELNKYLAKNIFGNKDLEKEFALDETRKIKVSADIAANTLVFQHPYSQTGMVKRAATENAGGITEGPKSTKPATLPASTSPSGAGKKADVLRGPKTTKPTPGIN